MCMYVCVCVCVCHAKGNSRNGHEQNEIMDVRTLCVFTLVNARTRGICVHMPHTHTHMHARTHACTYAHKHICAFCHTDVCLHMNAPGVARSAPRAWPFSPRDSGGRPFSVHVPVVRIHDFEVTCVVCSWMPVIVLHGTCREIDTFTIMH